MMMAAVSTRIPRVIGYVTATSGNRLLLRATVHQYSTVQHSFAVDWYDIPHIYSQNSFNPARLRQSTPITIAVAPAKEVEPIKPYDLVWVLKAKPKNATQNTPINIAALPPVEAITPPGLRTRIHMQKQNPPKTHPRPSVKSLNTRAPVASAIAGTTAAIRYPPCAAFVTGVFMT